MNVYKTQAFGNWRRERGWNNTKASCQRGRVFKGSWKVSGTPHSPAGESKNQSKPDRIMTYSSQHWYITMPCCCYWVVTWWEVAVSSATPNLLSLLVRFTLPSLYPWFLPVSMRKPSPTQQYKCAVIVFWLISKQFKLRYVSFWFIWIFELTSRLPPHPPASHP